MTLKNVKIKVPEGRTWQEVVAYLESFGYKMVEGCEDRYENKPFYFGRKSGSLLQDSNDYFFNFASDDYEEIFLPEKEFVKAPPIGLRPKAVVDALRIQEILEAMTRYAADGQKIPPDWIEELSDLNWNKE